MKMEGMSIAPKMKEGPDDSEMDSSILNKNVLTAEKGGKFPEGNGDQISNLVTEIENELSPLENLTKEKIAEILEKNPEKKATLFPKLGKLFNIGKIIVETAIAVIVVSKMQFNSHEELDFTPGNIAALIVAAPLILKIIWDLAPSDKNDSSKLKRAAI